MGSLSPMHWMIVLAVIVLLFGASKLPQLARSLGQSARVLKAETRGLADDQATARPDEQATEPHPLPGTTGAHPTAATDEPQRHHRQT